LMDTVLIHFAILCYFGFTLTLQVTKCVICLLHHYVVVVVVVVVGS
jgi:hypothetical protein